MRFDLTDLRLFLAVAEAGSLTGGAGRANLALASASERIRAMEDFAGAALLERLHRGVRPTPAGERLAHHARLILDAHDRMLGDLAKYGRGLKGHVRLIANTAAIAEHLAGPLAGFLAAHENVAVDVDEATSAEAFAAVAAGRADVGVASDQVDAGALSTTPFRRDALVLVAPKGHPLAGSKTASFADTLAFEHAGLTAGASLPSYLAGQARRLGRTMTFRVRVGSFESVCRMAEQGVGIGIVPAAAARRARRSMSIAVVPLADGWTERTLVIATRGEGSLSPHARDLVEWLRADAGRA
ncbi:LysR substrate-binding domain-containing protein [Methylopila sp. M107]|uniref:LysR substrate-binding domain-containing protein n=1 Tax=Methylopila sp. M107 TaxID=1101190 RepID=UPI000362D39C|nr:LysR substrate-binding domain-containing protein [Methylopila sp. M107]